MQDEGTKNIKEIEKDLGLEELSSLDFEMISDVIRNQEKKQEEEGDRR